MGCHSLHHGIFLTPGSNSRLLCLLHWQADSLPPSHQECPIQPETISKMLPLFQAPCPIISTIAKVTLVLPPETSLTPYDPAIQGLTSGTTGRSSAPVLLLHSNCLSYHRSGISPLCQIKSSRISSDPDLR